MIRGGLRKSWVTIHRWLGLTVGLLFVLLGLTGSLLVFDHAIDEWLNPDLLLTTGSGQPAPLTEVVAAAEQALPGAPVEAHSLVSPRVADGVWTAWIPTGSEDAPQWTLVYIDPYTAHVTGHRVWGEDLMSWIYKLHYTLHGGDAGASVVGIAGLVLMLSVATGIYLWWPLWKNSWRAAFAVRRRARFHYDLHKTFGIVSGLFLLVIAFTGVYMEFPEYVKPLATVFSAETEPPGDLKSTPGSAPMLTPEEAIAIGLRHFPEATFDHFHPPPGSDGVYEIGLRQPGEINRSFGRTQLWIDPHGGDLLAVRNPDEFTLADTFVAWQFPLHNGEAFGMIGRWIVFLVGFAPAVLYVTGFLMWRRRRRSRQKQQRGQQRSSHTLTKTSSRIGHRVVEEEAAPVATTASS